MSIDEQVPEIPSGLRPEASEFSFDLDQVLSSVVSVRSEIPEDAFTATSLGTDRRGHGVVITDRGLVLTIGYLIVEATQVWLIDGTGRAIAGTVAGYDQETGFGLIQALDPTGLTPMIIGRSGELVEGEPVIFAGSGGRAQALKTEVVSIREFAGYWEYLLDQAIFTSPPHPFWGGGALIGSDGTLRGIGSLFVQDSIKDGVTQEGNMVVPIDILEPILGDLATSGRSTKPHRPWLGLFTAETANKVVVAGLWDGGPAEVAGVEIGDLVLEVDSTPVTGMADMLRRIWALGDAGVEVPFMVFRDRSVQEVIIQSACREDYHKRPRMH
jgi:S1-C subfamily serine protease